MIIEHTAGRGNIGGRPAMEDLVRRSLSVNIGKLEAAGEALLQTAQTAAKTKRAKRRPGLLASKDCHRAALTLKAQCCEGQGTAQRRLTFKEDGTCELIPGEGPCQAAKICTWPTGVDACKSWDASADEPKAGLRCAKDDEVLRKTGGDLPPVEGTNRWYLTKTVKVLQAECETRKLKKSGKKAEVVARLVAAYAESGRVTAEQVQQPAPVGEGDDDTTIVEGQPDTHSGFAPDAQWPDATELEEAQLDEEQAIEARALTADPYELNEHDQLEEMRELMDQDEDPGDDFDF